MINTCKTCNKEIHISYFYIHLKQCKKCFHKERRKKTYIKDISKNKDFTEVTGKKRKLYIISKNIVTELRRKCRLGLICALKDLDKFFKKEIEKDK